MRLPAQASPQQQAEFHLAVARGLAVVYTLYAKTTGVSAKSFQKDLVSSTLWHFCGFHLPEALHTSCAPSPPSICACFKNALPQDRLQLYQKKVSKMAYEAELATAKPTLQLDVATANRFINAAMSDLPAAQREAVRQVSLHCQHCSHALQMRSTCHLLS